MLQLLFHTLSLCTVRSCKVVRVFPMEVVTIVLPAKFGPNANREFAPHFIVFEGQLGNMKKHVRYYQFYVFLHPLQN